MILPRFLSLFAILAVVLACCQPAPQPRIEPHAIVRVVAGTGEVDEPTIERVRRAVLHELPSLLDLFENKPNKRFFVHVHESRQTMPDALLAGVHADAVGFAVLGQHQVHLIVSEMVKAGSSVRGVVRHELVHELLDQYAAPNGRYMPRWFHEGLAQVVAGDTYLGAREEDLVWRVATSSLPGFGSMASRFPRTTVDVRTAYAQSYSYVAWLSRRYGLPLLLRVVRNTDRMTSFDRSLVARTERSTLQLEDSWRDYVLHGSGASWRVLFENWFGLMMIAVLPVLVLALIRRLKKEESASRQLRDRERIQAEAAARREAELAELRLAEDELAEPDLAQDDERDSG